MCHMAHHTPHPTPNAYRRRYPLELTPDENTQLETAAHQTGGSKRAAILAGLNALTETTQLRDTLTQTQADLTTANAEIEHVRRQECGRSSGSFRVGV